MELLVSEELPEDHRSGFVALLGKPNVGKSTLINAYVGRKVAIVSSKPQTTRRRLLSILTLPKAQIVFIETPGIHSPKHKLGEYMVETTTRALQDIDLVLFMVDVSEPPTEEGEEIARLVEKRKPAPIILALNKMDRLPPERLRPQAEAHLSLGEFEESMPISATRGTTARNSWPSSSNTSPSVPDTTLPTKSPIKTSASWPRS